MKNQVVTVTESKTDIQMDKRIMIPIIIMMIGVLGGSLFLYLKYISPSKKITAQKTDSKKEVESLMAKIGALYDLPKGETPTIATVSDKTKLEKQSFFAKAENGDQVLIYSSARKAILYRPSLNKIMEISPLIFSAPTGAPNISAAAPTTTPAIATVKTSISIYNGTKTAGLASITEKKIVEKFPTIEVTEKGNATKDYNQTVVVDISGKKTPEASALASFLGGSVSSLPEGEKKPLGEILVIMGK